MVALLQDTAALHKMMSKGMMQLSHEGRQKAETFQFTEKVVVRKKKDIFGAYKILKAIR